MFGLMSSTSKQTQLFQPVIIGADVLVGWYIARENAAIAAAQGPQLSGASSGKFNQNATNVTAPWEPGANPSPSADLARRALASGVFLDTDTYDGYSDADAPIDHKKLFALHQALKKLQGVAAQAAEKTANDLTRGFLDRRFAEGVAQIRDFLSTAVFEEIDIVAGEARAKAESAVAIPRSSDVAYTSVLHNGDFDAEVDAFQGARQFTLTVTKSNATTVINFDLAEMGATPRSLDNVADYINAKLDAEGLNTRFKRYKIGEADENGVIEGSRYGFQINGVATEKLSFSAPASASGALYLAGASGKPGEDSATAGQITKITDLDNAAPTSNFSQRIEIDQAIESLEEIDGLAIKAAKSDGQGGLYVLASSDAAVDGGATLRGDQDVLLIRLDSTGRRVWTRTLGAADTAQATSLAVGADGSVTVAGTIEGAFGDTIERGGADGFVTRYDDAGIEQWTHRLGGVGADAVNAVAVAADGTTYIAGKTTGSLTGAVHGGGSDAFVRAIDADGTVQWTRQIGDGDDEQATALAIADDGALIVGSVENGEGFVRKYSSADGVSASLWEHVIGVMDEGAINAIHADATGIYITGAARSGMTLAGSPVAHAGARDAFLIALDDGASPTVRFETFLGSASEDVAADVTVVGGAVFLAGYTDGALPSGSGELGTRDAFAAKFDATTGALAWTTQVTGRSGVSQGAALVVDANGASDLDAFGLPWGELVFEDDRAIAQRTTARAGDHFYVSVDGGRKIKIAIDADDTLRALTFKINTALVLSGEATVARKDGADALRITPEPGVTLELFAGGEGQDLLAALGLEAGKITAPPEADKDAEAAEKKAFELRFASDFGVSSFESAKEALSVIETAMAAVRSAYRHITRDRSLDALAEGPGKRGGKVPAYLLSKISNYEDALARLGGY